MGSFFGEVLALSVSVVGNLSIAGFFISPSSEFFSAGSSQDFGMIIFALEFLNVHSSAVAHGVAKSGYHLETSISFLKRNPKLALVAFYFLAAVSIGIAIKSWILPLYFAIGIVSKFFGRRASHDDRSIVYMIMLLLFAFMLGMRLWAGAIFFLFIWAMGFIFLIAPSFPLWRGWVAKRNEALKANPRMSDPKRQLFRDKLDFLQYSMPLIIFVPLYFLSAFGGSVPPGEFFWGVIYFPSLAVNDVAVFIRNRFYPQSESAISKK